jgi:hypothetical protein
MCGILHGSTSCALILDTVLGYNGLAVASNTLHKADLYCRFIGMISLVDNRVTGRSTVIRNKCLCR